MFLDVGLLKSKQPTPEGLLKKSCFDLCHIFIYHHADKKRKIRL
jgi:hypothetical protein